MPDIASLLPPNATAPERALEQAMARLAAAAPIMEPANLPGQPAALAGLGAAGA
ncbi:MAG: hypothetical protein PHU07_12305 [Acidocella sp.]|nr:hypothetical protein [Acidocella sp.]